MYAGLFGFSSQGGPQLATAIDPFVRHPARSAGLDNTDERTTPFTLSEGHLTTDSVVIYATSADIQSIQGTFAPLTRWTYWCVQSVGTHHHAPDAKEGREVPE